ncbi:hypothetical protein KVR01_007299 [Diaporthe batatas]|uniref:uncharacterized protein n=1 Tax=Diaporthe batatas TaxID=748121 RepID=UPI001D044D32|nr:uncharacterized protein KVR01_007299 [Diaporthe batatas]KAG8162821.1 hypothetical protein KVR01_007299 [Diaporthe batatas]
MPKRHNVTSEVVEGVRIRHLLAAPGKRIPWCDSCNRAMFQFLATQKCCPRNCGKDITALVTAMGCTYPGFEEAVWGKIKASLRRKLQDLDRDGNIVIYTDQDGVEQAHWPIETDWWRRGDWDGRRTNVVPDEIRQRLEEHGSLTAADGDRPREAAAPYVFERGSGGSEVMLPGAPDPSPPRDVVVGDGPRRRPSALSDDGLNGPADLSDDETQEPAARYDSYRPPSARTASEASSGSRHSRWGGGRGRRYAPWDTSAEVSHGPAPTA